jgi:hypothetical protein
LAAFVYHGLDSIGLDGKSMWYCWREEYYGSMVEVKRKAAGCVGGSKATIVAKQRERDDEGTRSLENAPNKNTFI